MKVIVFIIGGWLLFMVLSIVNEGLRNDVYKPIVGDLIAHQISTIIFILLILFITYSILRFTSIEITDNEALLIGVLWLLFTMTFEFLAGHLVFGYSWDKLFADYNLLKGRIWILVLITILLAPYLSNKLINMK